MRWTSSATHAILPLLATDAGIRLQVETGIASHRARFGDWDGGFWLPECAHAPWLDELLEEAGVHVTCVDWSEQGLTEPVRSAAGVILVPLDRPGVDRVWARDGYPSHGDYRDTNRLTPRRHQTHANDGSPYDPERGHARARAHAREFAASAPGVVAFDTELFGHHWHEGVTFLEELLALDAIEPFSVDATAPAPDVPPTSWGEGRDLRTWDGELAWLQRSAELRAVSAPPASGRCASCWRCRRPTGPSRSTTPARASTRSNGRRATTSTCSTRFLTRAVRKFAIWLRTWRNGPSCSRRLKFGGSPVDHLGEAACNLPPVIRAESRPVCPAGNGGTVGAMVRLPGRIAVIDGVAQVYARARQLTP